MRYHTLWTSSSEVQLGLTGCHGDSSSYVMLVLWFVKKYLYFCVFLYAPMWMLKAEVVEIMLYGCINDMRCAEPLQHFDLLHRMDK